MQITSFLLNDILVPLSDVSDYLFRPFSPCRIQIFNQYSEAANSFIFRATSVAAMTVNAVCVRYGQEKTFYDGDDIYI